MWEIGAVPKRLGDVREENNTSVLSQAGITVRIFKDRSKKYKNVGLK